MSHGPNGSRSRRYGGKKARHPASRAILARLDEIRTCRAIQGFTPPGRPANLKALDHALGLAAHRLSQIIYGHVRLDADNLFDVLDRLGEDPAAFLVEVLGPGELHAGRLLEEIEAEHRDDPDPLADLPAGELPAPTAEEGSASPELEERLVRLDERRVVDPRGALPVALELWRELAQASGTDRSRAHVERLCRCLGAIGSMARNETGGFGAAARCLRLAWPMPSAMASPAPKPTCSNAPPTSSRTRAAGLPPSSSPPPPRRSTSWKATWRGSEKR